MEYAKNAIVVRMEFVVLMKVIKCVYAIEVSQRRMENAENVTAVPMVNAVLMTTIKCAHATGDSQK
ncbi:unnamed protein product [Larinioides sclopetarius]|uniref:Uncharacterized protein n=1 Tax=Larinioides sclopetarius TaxID=280406 RepID=A0AAV2C0J1_9ARAC